MPTINRDGVEIHYRIKGTGHPVVLHHALTADLSSWDTIGMTDALCEAGFSCILIDAAGHGRSKRAGDRLSLGERVKDVLALADALGADRFAFVGYSMGGWVGTGLLAAARERLTAMVIAGWDVLQGAILFTDETTREGRSTQFENLARRLAADSATQEQLKAYVDTYLHFFSDLPSMDAIGNARVPLLFVAGQADPYCGNVERAAAQLHFPVAIVAGDHVSAFQSREFAAHARDWLADVHSRHED